MSTSTAIEYKEASESGAIQPIIRSTTECDFLYVVHNGRAWRFKTEEDLYAALNERMADLAEEIW